MKPTSWLSAPVLLSALTGISACAPDLTCEGDWCGTIVVTAAPVRSVVPPLAAVDVDLGVADLLFSKLAYVGPHMNTVRDTGFVPKIASGWEFEGPSTISFSIDQNARWHDGAPVTASDVAFTFDVYRSPAVNAFSRSRLDAIESVTARDSATVVFEFRREYLEQFFDAVYHMHILPEHLLGSIAFEDLRSHEFALNPIGCGPYRFVRWTPGEVLELTADSTYHLGRPGTRRIIWQPASGPTPAVNQLIGNTADYHHSVAEASDIPRVLDTPHLRLFEYTSHIYNYVAFNLRDPDNPEMPHPLFGNRDLRRAITMAVDRPSLTESVVGPNGIQTVGPVTPFLWIWEDDLHDGLPFDSARARAALEALGWHDTDSDGVLDREGRPLAFNLVLPPISVRSRGAVILQSQLSRMGIQMDIEEIEWAAFNERIRAGQFDAQYNGIAQDPSPSALATNWTEAGFGEYNYGKYSNPEFTRLANEAVNATDRAVALSRWHEALRIINEDAPALWLYIPRLNAAVHERFENVSVLPGAPWAMLPSWRLSPSGQIERDLFGSN